MEKQPRLNDFVKDVDGLVYGYIAGEGSIKHKRDWLPVYKVSTGYGKVHVIPKSETVIVNRDGFAWEDWLRYFYHTRCLSCNTLLTSASPYKGAEGIRMMAFITDQVSGERRWCCPICETAAYITELQTTKQ